MDPLSVTASIIAILGTGGAVAKGLAKIRGLKDAPTTLLQLNNEVSDLTLLVRAVDELCRSHRTSLAPATQEEVIYCTLKRARSAVLDLEKLVEYTLIKETGSGSQVNRTAWVGSLDRVKETMTTLRAARNDLITVWAALGNRLVSSRIELELQEVSIAVGNLQSVYQEHRTMLDRTTSLTLNQGRLLETIQEELRRSGVPTPIPEQHQSIGAPLEVLPTGNLTGDVVSEESKPWSTIALRLTKRSNKGCKCSCHRQKRIRSPSYLSHFFGTLFVGYVGLPGFSTKCGFKTPCCKHAEIKGSIVYVFPLWFTALAIMAGVEHSQRKGPQRKGPQMLIRCLRVRPFRSHPFQALAQGQCQQVKTLIMGAKASIFDVAETGSSLLSYAVKYYIAAIRNNSHKVKQYHSLIDFLLHEGADAHQEDQFMMSPYRNTWELCVVNRLAVKRYPVLYAILSKGNPIETFGFMDLHVAVLNLSTLSTFEATLALTPRETVNEPDCTGRTAVSWAAELGEINKINSLLAKGADPNLADLSGRSALYWCAHKVECMKALLDAGAEADQADNEFRMTKMGAIIRYSEPHGDIDCLELLWKHGACLNHPCGSDRDLIHWAVQFYRPRILRWLLEKPIDLEARSSSGGTPLLHFLSCDIGEHPDILEILLNKQPNYQATDFLEEGLCHYIARVGSLTFLQVFQRRTDLAELDVDRRGLRGLKIYEESVRGKTAMELAEWRRDCQSEWSLDGQMEPDPDPLAFFTAFKAWIDGIRVAHLARSRDIREMNDERAAGHGEQLEAEMGSEQNAEANKGLSRRVPGSFPDK